MQDHLGWGKVHVVGHSMGAMVAEKVAVQQPGRVQSLLLISATGGGWQAVPRSLACLKICIQVRPLSSMQGLGQQRAVVLPSADLLVCR